MTCMFGSYPEIYQVVQWQQLQLLLMTRMVVCMTGMVVRMTGMVVCMTGMVVCMTGMVVSRVHNPKSVQLPAQPLCCAAAAELHIT